MRRDDVVLTPVRASGGTPACMNGCCGSLLDTDEYSIDRFNKNILIKKIVIYNQRSRVFGSRDLFV